MSRARLLLLLNVISDRIAAEAQLTEEESIEFSSDITIILSLVYKHTFTKLREYHPFQSPTAEHRASVLGAKHERAVKLGHLIRLLENCDTKLKIKRS